MMPKTSSETFADENSPSSFNFESPTVRQSIPQTSKMNEHRVPRTLKKTRKIAHTMREKLQKSSQKKRGKSHIFSRSKRRNAEFRERLKKQGKSHTLTGKSCRKALKKNEGNHILWEQKCLKKNEGNPTHSTGKAAESSKKKRGKSHSADAKKNEGNPTH